MGSHTDGTWVTIHPHMLRHATGFKLANQGVDTRSLQHEYPAPVRYTPIASGISGKTNGSAR